MFGLLNGNELDRFCVSTILSENSSCDCAMINKILDHFRSTGRHPKTTSFFVRMMCKVDESGADINIVIEMIYAEYIDNQTHSIKDIMIVVSNLFWRIAKLLDLPCAERISSIIVKILVFEKFKCEPDVVSKNIVAAWHNVLSIEQVIRSTAAITAKQSSMLSCNMLILKVSLDDNVVPRRCEHVVRYLCSLYRTLTKANMKDNNILLLQEILGIVFALCLLAKNKISATHILSIKDFVHGTNNAGLITTWLKIRLTLASETIDKELCWCHNASCKKLDGPHELSLVTYSDGIGKRFCGRECQAADWKRSQT